jgi:hypothetical protein
LPGLLRSIAFHSWFTKVSLLAVVSITLPIANITNTSIANAAPNSIEINSISEVSCTSVEILFESSVPKKSLVNYVITAAVDTSVGQPKNIKKIIKTKATGLITAEIKNLNPKVAYKFSVSAKTNKGKMISSEVVEYSSLCNLMELLSNLPADWGNPKPIQLPTPAPTAAPIAAPAFTLSSSSETRTVNTAATGFTINSTGGAIASFAINSTPPGMSFNTTTGALTGTPNTVAGATAYTVTATNASGSTTQTFTLTVTAVVYTVGQTGPGGGKVFYVAATAFSCGPTLAATCTYLEAAPSGWNTVEDPTLSWATNANSNQTTTVPAPGAIQTAIGTGYQNSNTIVAQTGNVAGSSAAVAARAYGGNGLTDWYLPSKDELNQMCKWQRGVAWTSDATVCTGGSLNSATNGASSAGFVEGDYWSSSENDASSAWYQIFLGGFQLNDGLKSYAGYVRPVRAF